MTRTVRGRDVVGFVIHGIFDKHNVGVLLEQLIKLLGQISAHQIDLLNARCDHGIQQGIDNSLTLDTHQGLGRIERNGHQARAKARRHKDGALDTIGLQRGNSCLGDCALLHISQLAQLGYQLIDRSNRQLGGCCQLTLGFALTLGLQAYQN